MGAPIVDIQFAPLSNMINPLTWKRARGWIAIGDVATGRLVGIGYFAIAPFAVGNMTVGIVSLGVLSSGLLATGILTAGIVSVGMIALGVFATGMTAVGYISRGFFTLGLDAEPGIQSDASNFQPSLLSGYSDNWLLRVADFLLAKMSPSGLGGLGISEWIGLLVFVGLLLCIYQYQPAGASRTSSGDNADV
ncbi:hypothetical protein [Rhodopirellula bahusiensis]|uniref:hypothetical protein n=1 Tax=Rhodopirellula bahusiensis TaxID=2014065 RepID=UPI003262CD0E